MNLTTIRHIILLTLGMLLLSTSCVEEGRQAHSDFAPTTNNATTEAVEAKEVIASSFTEGLDSDQSGDRENWQKPRMVIQSLGDLSDKVVADIGAGTGYFTMPILPLAEKVIAIDIDERMILFIEDLKKELDERFRSKLESRLASASDPKLKDKEVDIVFMSNTYSYISDRVAYCRNLKSKLKPGGKIVIIDFKKKLIPKGIHPDQENRLALFQVEAELKEAGFTLTKSDDLSLPYQYIVEAK